MADPVAPGSSLTNPAIIKKPLTADQTKVLTKLKDEALKADKTLDVDKAKAILKTNVTGLTAGKDDAFIDSEQENEFLSALLNADVGDEFKPLQEQLTSALKGDKLDLFKKPLGPAADKDKKVDDGSVEYEKKIAGSEPLEDKDPARPTPAVKAPVIESIQSARKVWRTENVKNTFAVNSKDLKAQAAEIANAIGGADKAKQIRGILNKFWNNDGANVKFISIHELEAIRAWGEEAYVAAGKTKEDFYKDFKEQFLKSVKEDTPFSVDLMARQWTELMGSSKFVGGQSTEFKTFFTEFGKGIAQGVVDSKPAGTFKAGDTIAAFNGKAEHPGFDNVSFTVGAAGIELNISKSSMGDVFKIAYDFDGAGAAGGAGGLGGPGAGKPLPNDKVDKVNEEIKALKAEKDKFPDANKKAVGDLPDVTADMSLDNLKALAGTLADLLKVAPDGVKAKVTSLIGLVNELVKLKSAVPPPKPDDAKPLAGDADVEKITKGNGGIDGITKDINALPGGDPKKAAAKLILEFPMITRDSTVKDLKTLKGVLDKFNTIAGLDDKIKEKIKALIAQIDKLITP